MGSFDFRPLNNHRKGTPAILLLLLKLLITVPCLIGVGKAHVWDGYAD